MSADDSPNVWQIATGDTSRNYADLFRKYDVMFMGPGDWGSYETEPENYEEAQREGWETPHKIGQIRRFFDSVQPDDIVLMRRGHYVESIGIAHQDGYSWNPCFDDVFGWCLQHTRRVVWQEDLEPHLRRIQRRAPLFGNRKQIPTFTAVRDSSVIDPISGLFNSLKKRRLRVRPRCTPS
jgi:hypothetical protein